MKRSFRMQFLVACLSMLSACLSTEWSATSQGAAIAQLAAVRSLGIAVFDPVMQPSGRLLIGTGGVFSAPVDVDGVTHTVSLLATAADASSIPAVNRDGIAQACLLVWVGEIGTAHRFDYQLSRGMMPARILGETAEGQPVPTGYDKVRAVPERLSRADASETRIRDLCRQHGLDALLAVEPSVIMEAGQVSPQPSEHPLGREIDPGNFILRSEVRYEYVLFDGRTGAAITDSTRCRPQYDTQRPPEAWIVDLGPSNPRAVMGILNGPGFPSGLTRSMREALKPYLTLFRGCVVAAPQKR
jgi:hypothetical protein